METRNARKRAYTLVRLLEGLAFLVLLGVAAVWICGAFTDSASTAKSTEKGADSSLWNESSDLYGSSVWKGNRGDNAAADLEKASKRNVSRKDRP